jgi:hypothetical protein
MNADPTVGSKPRRKPASARALQLRLEQYAAAGPNCPNGHPWASNAKFTYHGYRFCDACVRAKAEARRNDPTTYTGACPRGHAYTHENTMITCWNTKMCVKCLRKPDAKPRPLKPGLMDELLRRARNGATTNALAGWGHASHRGKGIISRLPLIAAYSADTPKAKELKRLLEQNGKAAISPGRAQYRWSPESLALLTTEIQRGTSTKQITGSINERFGSDFSPASISAKANKLRLERPPRIIVPRTPKPRRPAIKVPKLPPLIADLHFPAGSILDRINAVVPRHLARDHRDDVIGEMALAVYEGHLEEADLERRVREFVNAGYQRDHDQHRTVSLDAPLYEDSSIRLIDKITTGLWQSYDQPDFHIHDAL